MTLVVGSHFHPGNAEAIGRQERAIASLERLRGVTAVDLQWKPGPERRPWLPRVPALRRDSTSVTGAAGRGKPIACDVFDALADVAERDGHRYFLFFNSDLVLTQDAVDRIVRDGKDAYGFSRLDIEGGQEPSIMTYGLDAFAFDVAWWRANRTRFRPYILGEMCWDNVYAAILMTHGRGVIENRHGEMAHPRHPTVWGEGPFSDYNGFLAALDGRYFSLWVRYHDALLVARERGLSEEEERAMAASIFRWRPSAGAAARQLATAARARLRYRAKRRGWTA